MFGHCFSSECISFHTFTLVAVMQNLFNAVQILTVLKFNVTLNPYPPWLSKTLLEVIWKQVMAYFVRKWNCLECYEVR